MNGAEVDRWDKTEKGQPDEDHKVFLREGMLIFFLSDTK